MNGAWRHLRSSSSWQWHTPHGFPIAGFFEFGRDRWLPYLWRLVNAGWMQMVAGTFCMNMVVVWFHFDNHIGVYFQAPMK